MYTIASLDGFCDYGLLVETPHGFYTVTESKVGDEAVEQECYYNYTKEAGPDGRAMSKCIGPEEWEIDGEECITRITALFRNISMVLNYHALHICMCLNVLL